MNDYVVQGSLFDFYNNMTVNSHIHIKFDQIYSTTDLFKKPTLTQTQCIQMWTMEPICVLETETFSFKKVQIY